SDGALYESGDGQGTGTIIRWDAFGADTEIHTYTTAEGFPTGFTLGSDGLLYAVTPDGGSGGMGTAFRFDTAGNVTLLHEFNAPAPAATALIRLHRAGPPVPDDHRQRVRLLRADVDEVDVEPVDRRHEVREGAHPRFDLPPVVVRTPIRGELL